MKPLVFAVLFCIPACIGPEHEEVASIPRPPPACAAEPDAPPAADEAAAACLRCERTMPDAAAYRCSHRCTFCEACSTEMEHVCPNCGGHLASSPDG